MHDLEWLEVLYSRDDLLEKFASLDFGDFLVFDDVVKQFTFRDVLHDQVEGTFGFDYFIELDNMRMLHDLQNMDFSADALYICDVYNFWLPQNFYSYLKELDLALTFSPVMMWTPAFTLPNVPSPRHLPSM